MTAQEIDLQRSERVVRDALLRERAKAGIDAIDRFVAGGMLIDNGSRRIDAPRRVRIERDGCVVVRNRDQLLEREIGASQMNHGRIAATSPRRVHRVNAVGRVAMAGMIAGRIQQ